MNDVDNKLINIALKIERYNIIFIVVKEKVYSRKNNIVDVKNEFISEYIFNNNAV